MSTFKVTIEKLNKVWNHPNADALDLAQVEGMSYQFVMSRNSVKQGDLVVYFPIDTLFPEKVLKVLPEAITKKLGGKDHNRLKTVKLRQEISQGLAFEVDKFPLRDFIPDLNDITPGLDITQALGVEKYEPPVVNMGNCKMTRLPEASPHYDIEGCDRYGHVLETILDHEVAITEKLEGTNLSVVCEFPSLTVHVCQRSFAIIPEEGAVNLYHEGAKRENLPEIAKQMALDLQQTVTIRGELLGPNIQGNIYKFPTLVVRVFEIWLDGRPIDWLKQDELTKKYNIPTVPLLHVGKLRDILNGKTIQAFSDGISVVQTPKPILREGVVIRPVRELPEIPGFGRVLLKQRSPQYLAGSEF